MRTIMKMGLVVALLITASTTSFAQKFGYINTAEVFTLMPEKDSADVKIQAVERNRLKAGACVKMRGTVSNVKAAMEAALDAAKGRSKVVSHTVIAAPSEDTETAIAMTIGK